jgi:hypothetical protein
MAVPLPPRGAEAAGTGARPAAPGHAYADARTAPSGNALAVVAFVLACVTLVMFFSAGMILNNHSLEFEEFTKLVEESGTTLSGQMKAWNEFLERRGGQPPVWFFAFTALSFGSMALGVVALVCGLVAVRRLERRGLAIAALCITGFYMMLMCGGMLIGS